MSLQSIARTALAAIATATGSQVTVVSNGVTVEDCPRNTRTTTSAMDEYGEQGGTVGTVWVDASKMDQPAKNATIIVDGDTVMVTEVGEDSVGAMWAIQYRVIRKVEGV